LRKQSESRFRMRTLCCTTPGGWPYTSGRRNWWGRHWLEDT